MKTFKLVSDLRRKRPLIHCISNTVTANDCANLLLAVGASPIMAQAADEMDEIAARADALVLNTGTPDRDKFDACRAAGLRANACKVPVVLDPVGAGASRWRLENITSLLAEVHPAMIRANLGEAMALLGGDMLGHGVDSEDGGIISARCAARALAEKYGCVVLLTGTEDIVADALHDVSVTGGSALMKQVTGAGCMLSCLCGAMLSVSEPFEAAETASRLWKQIAEDAEKNSAGLGSFRTALFDLASRIGLEF